MLLLLEIGALIGVWAFFMLFLCRRISWVATCHGMAASLAPFILVGLTGSSTPGIQVIIALILVGGLEWAIRREAPRPRWWNGQHETIEATKES